jgi:hypothetical protein
MSKLNNKDTTGNVNLREILNSHVNEQLPTSCTALCKPETAVRLITAVAILDRDYKKAVGAQRHAPAALSPTKRTSDHFTRDLM